MRDAWKRLVGAVNEGVDGPGDVVMDVELFLRMLEWAREDGPDDLELHRAGERAEALTARRGELTMRDYETLTDGGNGAYDADGY